MLLREVPYSFMVTRAIFCKLGVMNKKLPIIQDTDIASEMIFEPLTRKTWPLFVQLFGERGLRQLLVHVLQAQESGLCGG